MLKHRLPEPEPQALEVSIALINHIKQNITQGSISFKNYMNQVLYTPDLGYYANAKQKFGKTGDFITAPEASTTFSQTLANYCIEKLKETSGDICEFGAGSGKMASIILQELQKTDITFKHYYIVELSGHLSALQQQTIKQYAPDLYEKVIWLQAWPENFTGVILANEVLDAMPVHLFEIKENTIFERYVTWENNNFNWILQQPDVELQTTIKTIQEQNNLPENYLSEINTEIKPWLQSLAEHLKSAYLLFIDYGYQYEKEYYHPSRYKGSLMCHYKHHAHDNPFVYPGLQDITTHVNFEAVLDAALELGFNLDFFAEQKDFLLHYGIEQYFEKAYKHSDETERFYLANQMKMLLLPTEMGQRFKVLSLKIEII